MLLTDSKGGAGLKMPGSQNTGVKIPYFPNRPQTSYQTVKKPIKNPEERSTTLRPFTKIDVESNQMIIYQSMEILCVPNSEHC